MELTRVDEVTLEQAKKKKGDGHPDGQLEWWNFHKFVYLDFRFLSAACALGVCCTATIASGARMEARGRSARLGQGW
jgi:hypothetical protein